MDLADLGMGEECLVPFLAEVIGTPPDGKRAGRAEARRLQRAAACSRWALAHRKHRNRPGGEFPRKMSARRHLKYYLKVLANSLFSGALGVLFGCRSKMGIGWCGVHRKKESFALALHMSARRH